MAETEFLKTEAETLILANHILSLNCKLIPRLHYVTKDYLVIDNLTEFENNLRECRTFHIVGDHFTKFPLAMNDVERPEGKRYYIMSRIGGPSIDLLVPKRVYPEGKESLSAGSIGIYPSIFTIEEEEIKASSDLKSFYSKLTTFVKKDTIKIKTKYRTYYASRGIIEEIKSGVLVVGIPPEYLEIVLKI